MARRKRRKRRSRIRVDMGRAWMPQDEQFVALGYRYITGKWVSTEPDEETVPRIKVCEDPENKDPENKDPEIMIKLHICHDQTVNVTLNKTTVFIDDPEKGDIVTVTTKVEDKTVLCIERLF